MSFLEKFPDSGMVRPFRDAVLAHFNPLNPNFQVTPQHLITFLYVLTLQIKAAPNPEAPSNPKTPKTILTANLFEISLNLQKNPIKP
jgi:hypothetical protein